MAATVATIKAQALERISEITAQPKPTYSIDGQSVSWGEYLLQLQETVAWCDAQANADDPCEVVTQGFT
jgi:pyruvate-formate lyase-activating enzyme